MIRRSRFKMAPNVAASSSVKPTTIPVNAEPKKDVEEKKEIEVEIVENSDIIEECENRDEHERIVIIDEPTELEENNWITVAHVIESPQHTAAASAPPQPRPKRKRGRDEELDVKEFTLADLIDWTPKTENTLRKKWNENRKKMLEMVEVDGGKLGVDDRASLGPPEKKEAVGPRVKINEKGEMVLDEESLVVRDDPNSLLVETVDDDLLPKKLNSMSFRKRNYRRGAKWTELETEMFYEVLSATGTDFGIMHEFVQSRTRLELKRKFNYEERSNSERIAQALDNPTLLDESLLDRVERLRTRIEKDLEGRLAAAEQARLMRRERGRPPRKGTRRETSADERDYQAREQRKRERAEARQAKRHRLKTAMDMNAPLPIAGEDADAPSTSKAVSTKKDDDVSATVTENGEKLTRKKHEPREKKEKEKADGPNGGRRGRPMKLLDGETIEDALRRKSEEAERRRKRIEAKKKKKRKDAEEESDEDGGGERVEVAAVEKRAERKSKEAAVERIRESADAASTPTEDDSDCGEIVLGDVERSANDRS